MSNVIPIRRHQQLAATTPARNRRRLLAERDPDATVRAKLRAGIEEFRQMLESVGTRSVGSA